MSSPSKKEKVVATVIIAQGLLLVAQFAGSSPRPAHAELQLPNPSERQIETIEELKGVNARLDKVLSLMQSGEFQVRVSKPEDAPAAPPADAK